MTAQVCIDASLAIKWLFPEDYSTEAENLLTSWNADNVALVAPPLFSAEVTSVVRERAFRRELSLLEADETLEITFLWPVTLSQSTPELQRIALTMAHRFDRPKAYDAQYLALADLIGCELWTGDQRLINSLRGALPWVKWVGEFQSL